MAMVVVFYPLRVYSSSKAALRNPVGIQHTVCELIADDEFERARVMCGQLIGFQLLDTETRRGQPRPTKLCENCVKSLRDEGAVSFIGVSGGGSRDVPERAEGTGQESQLW